MNPTREEVEAAIAQFDEGGWHNIKDRRSIIAAARLWLWAEGQNEEEE
jgi:hypothetical protein